ncbi:unnamed protein product [Dibothriocephalus latus]|uniref:Peptidase aspartic putative domain-containing protein n=1 Tax=Dibothriocephalus latus TaxID=60516 RepID=A0A3P7PPC8_DIBLA|nr:unnamed protein product [Dibothriocephalus latus]
MVARTFIDALIDGPQIKVDDTAALIHLSQQMQACSATLFQLNYTSDLNSSRTLESIVRKLPSQLRFKWAETAAKSIRQGKEPHFEDLANFIEERVDIACTHFGELATSLRGDRENRHCTICGEPHYPNKCPVFIAYEVKERRTIVHERKLCRCGLKANHIARNCWSPRGCTVEGCGKEHNILLHQDDDELNRRDSRGSLAVVPMTIRYKQHTTRTLVLLDNGSDSTLIHDSLVSALGMKGKSKDIGISTLYTETVFPTMEVEFDVESKSRTSSIHVRRAYSVNSLPRANRIMLSYKMTSLWPHLSTIEFESRENMEIGLLLGCDIPEAHWVHDQRLGKADEPFAIQTTLGWVMMGPVHLAPKKNKAVYCSNIAEF